MALTWTQLASLQGIKGDKGDPGAAGASTPQTLPNDLTGNSLALAPVSGDNTPVSLKLGNGTSTLFAVDASGSLSAAATAIVGNESVGGNLTVTGNETVGGSLTVSGALKTASLINTGSGTAAGLFSSIAGTVSAPSFSYTAQTDSGLYLANTSASAAILAIAVNAVQSLALNKAGITVPGTLTVSGASTLAGLTTSGSTVNGNETISGTLSVSAGTTLAALSATTISAASLTLTGNANIGGNLGVTGLLTASGSINTPTIVTTQAPTTTTAGGSGSYIVSNVQLPGSFGDANTSYPRSGISSDTLGNLIFNYQGQPVIRTSNPGYNSANGTTPATAFPTVFSSGNYQWTVGGNTQLAISANGVRFGYNGNTIPVTMQALSGNILTLQNSGTPPLYQTQTVATVNSAGLGTFTGLALSSATGLTFADNSVQTSAFTPTAASNQQRYYANANGTAALPSHTFSANTDTGVYLKTSSTTAAVLGLSVNATDALTATSGGVSIPGTLGVSGTLTGSSANLATLTVSGGTTAGIINCGALTSSAAVKSTALTITASGGALTFGDGTTQTTAAGAVTAGSAAKFTATSNGATATPSFTFANNTDTGMYLSSSSATTALMALSVNATDVVYASKTGLTFVPSATFNANATVNGNLSVTGTTSFNGIATFNNYVKVFAGSAANPAIISNQDTNTGPHYGVRTYYISCGGTDIATFSSTGFNLTGSMTATSGIQGNVFFATETGRNSSTNPTYGSSQNGGYGLYINSTAATPITGLSCGTNSFIESTSSKTTLGLPVVHSSTTALTGVTTAAATITSTTAVGTPSFVSSQGFKSYYDMGSLVYASGATLPTSPTQLMRNGTTYNRSFVPAVATSVMGVSAGLQQTLTTPVTITMNVNGTVTTVGTIAAGSTTFSTMYPKGQYPLAAGNYFFLNASFGSSAGQTNPVQIDANAIIEMAA